MARNPVDVVIDGHTFTIYTIDPFASLRIFTRLTKLLAPAAGKLAEAGASAGDEQASVSWFVDALGSLSERLDPEVVETVVRDLLENVQIDGRKLSIAGDFVGEVPRMLRVAAEVARVEYGGFLKFAPVKPSPGAAPSP